MKKIRFERVNGKRTIYDVILNDISIGRAQATPFHVHPCDGLKLTCDERFALQMQARRELLHIL